MIDPTPTLRLTGRQWFVASALVLLVLWLTPMLWSRADHFAPNNDYRIPYSLSDDYWLYERRVAAARAAQPVYVVGDSVVWGEYVLSDGTWSHFLNREAGGSDRFVNAGVNGLFPLALEGLIAHYGEPIQHSKVILHANLLWMSSPKADLNVQKEEKFNHVALVPQFQPRIPCYKADVDARLGVVIRRQIPFFGWVDHLQDACFDQQNIMKWTLTMEDGEPPTLPNAYRNPLAQLSLDVPAEPVPDPQRGAASPRHRPWSEAGMRPTRFEWVELESSLQWGAFRRLVALLRSRGNQVFVVVGPFNEHMLVAENQQTYRQRRGAVLDWLTQQQVPHSTPATLPSEQYGDASHPLTEGYARLARELWAQEAFRQFVR